MSKILIVAEHLNGRLNAATAAAALHHAVRIQREAHPDQPMRWALFTHTGP